MARVPAILRPLGGPLSGYPEGSFDARRLTATTPAPPFLARLGHWGAVVALALAVYMLAGLVVAALAGFPALSADEVLTATVNSLVLAVLGTLLALGVAVVLALAAVAGPAELQPAATRALAVAAAVPPIVVAVAAVLTIGRPTEPVIAVLAVIGVQGLILGPILANRLIVAASAANPAADEAAIDLGACGWTRFRLVVWPHLSAACPWIVAVGLLWSLSDIVTPVLLAGPLPTVAGLLWRHALAGDGTVAAALAILLLALSGLAGLLTRSAITPAGRGRVPLALPSGWASLVLTVAVAVLFPLVMAPLVLVTAAGGEVAPLLWSWPTALGGALLGALLAVLATLGLRALNGSRRREARWLELVPPPALAVGAVVTFGALAGAFDLGALVLVAALSLVTGLQAADDAALQSAPLRPGALEAASDLGAHPAAVAPPASPREVSAGVLRVAAETLGAGATALVILAGVNHPLVIALSSELIAQRPAAAAAALSILIAVAILRGAATWAARRPLPGERS